MTESSRRVLKLITSAHAVGTFYLWARITDTPEIDWVRLQQFTVA